MTLAGRASRNLRRRLLLAALLLGLLVTAPLQAVIAAKPRDVRARPFAFTVTNVPYSRFGEPSIALSPKDHLFICGPTGKGNGFIRSADWKNFSRATITDPVITGEDCDVKVGRDGTVYEADLQLFGSAIRRSTDDGRTFSSQPYEDSIEQDRQWLAPDPADRSIVYLAYHDYAGEQEVVAKSIDGGGTFPIHTLASNSPTLARDTGDNTFSGPIRVSPVNHNVVAVAYGISTSAANVQACNLETQCFGSSKRVVAAVSTDGGLTFTDSVAMDISGLPGERSLGNMFPWLTWDRVGTLYVMAAELGWDPAGGPTTGIYYASSKNQGKTWSSMHKVNVGSGAVVFPSMVGGKGGVVDFAWIQSNQTDEHADDSVWRVHFAQSRNADTSRPTFSQVTGPIVRHGSVCTLGSLCPDDGSRVLLDFLEVALDTFGYAHAVVASSEPYSGLPVHVVYWRQDAGPSAYSSPCARIGTPGCVYARPGPRA